MTSTAMVKREIGARTGVGDGGLKTGSKTNGTDDVMHHPLDSDRPLPSPNPPECLLVRAEWAARRTHCASPIDEGATYDR